MLVASYRLLAQVASSIDRPMRLVDWEHPWTGTVVHTETGGARRVRLPAAAVLIQDHLGGGHARAVLLLPEPGTLPVASYGPMLRRLMEVRGLSAAHVSDAQLLVVGVVVARGVAARAVAWTSLLQHVGRRAG